MLTTGFAVMVTVPGRQLGIRTSQRTEAIEARSGEQVTGSDTILEMEENGGTLVRVNPIFN